MCEFVHEPTKNSTRKRLVTEENNITFKRKVEIATNVEKATAQARE